ncbi:MAG: hypothetical protein AAF202_03400 [Pseudomonadota bacterium]
MKISPFGLTPILPSALLLLFSSAAPAIELGQFTPTNILRSCSSAMGLTRASNYRVVNTEITVEAETKNQYREWQPIKRFGIQSGIFEYRASLSSQRRLSIGAKLVDHHSQTRSQIRGKEVFLRAIDHFGIENIDLIVTSWMPYSDNHRLFREALIAGKRAKEAAFASWTGGRAKELGFANVSRIVVRPTGFQSAAAEPLSDMTELVTTQDMNFSDFHYSVTFAKNDRDATGLRRVEGPLLKVGSVEVGRATIHDFFFGFQLNLEFERSGITILSDSIWQDGEEQSVELKGIKEVVDAINLLLNPQSTSPSAIQGIKAHLRQMRETLSRIQAIYEKYDDSNSVILEVLEQYKSTFEPRGTGTIRL